MTSDASSTTERTVLGPPSMSVVVYEGSVLYAVGDESRVAGAGLCFSDTSVLLFFSRLRFLASLLSSSSLSIVGWDCLRTLGLRTILCRYCVYVYR